MWKLIGKTYTWEMWKTSTRYLVCFKYIGKFRFFDNFNEAKKYFDEVKNA